MRAHLAVGPSFLLAFSALILPASGDDPAPPTRRMPAISAPKPEAGPATPARPAVTPASAEDVAKVAAMTAARLRAFNAPEVKDKPEYKAIRELLDARSRLLAEWTKLGKERNAVEHPERSPERDASESKADAEKTRALLEQSARSADALLPEVFLSGPSTAAKPSEFRLAEMKEAIDAARVDLRDRTAELETLKADGTRNLAAELAAVRGERDKVHQGLAALIARRGEREAEQVAAASPEAREMARERLANLEWECRVEAERLALMEARINLAARRLDVGAFQIQARAAHVQLAKRLLDRMEVRYAALAESQRVELRRAVAKEETRAASSGDVLERYRAKHSAAMLELESQVVAYEKANATSPGLSIQELTTLADAAVRNFEELKKLFGDGEVSPLDVLRLKNEYRRIVPERAQVVRTDLAASNAEQAVYQSALNDAEIDLVNDARDDRFDREALLEQVPESRRAEANALLDELETRHKALLNRRRNVLQKLAVRAEEAHTLVVHRLATLDEQYAFIRTHIFWVRDADPVGVSTFAHARDDAFRAARGVVKLALHRDNGRHWGHPSPLFYLIVAALALLPWPLHMARKALDRLRTADGSFQALGPAVPDPRPAA